MMRSGLLLFSEPTWAWLAFSPHIRSAATVTGPLSALPAETVYARLTPFLSGK